MTDKTKPEAMTAERMAHIERVSMKPHYGAAARLHVVELLSALEEARRRLDRAHDCGQDDVCATPPGCGRHWAQRNWELVTERDSAIAASAESARKYAEAAVRVAELEGALDRDKTGLGTGLNRVCELARGYGWISAGEWGSYDYTQRTEETLRREVGWCLEAIEKTAREALEASGTLAQKTLCPSAAPPEQAPARCVGCGHAPHETGTCGLGCECIVDGQEQAPAPPRTDDRERPVDVGAAPHASTGTAATPAPNERIERAAVAGAAGLLLDVQRDFGRLAKAALRLVAANHGEIDTEEGQKEGLAAEAEVLALIGEDAEESAPVTVYCSPRVAERAAPSGIEVDPAITPEQIRRDSDRDTAAMFAEEMAPPTADPLCARDLGGGRKCGHRPSEHRPARSPWGCRLCPCSGFIPPAPPKEKRCPCGLMVSCSAPESHRIGCPDLAKAQAAHAAGLPPPLPDGEPNYPALAEYHRRNSVCTDGGIPPGGDAEVSDGGTARTCETCKHYDPDTVKPCKSGCGWSPKSGGSSTEGGESHG